MVGGHLTYIEYFFVTKLDYPTSGFGPPSTGQFHQPDFNQYFFWSMFDSYVTGNLVMKVCYLDEATTHWVVEQDVIQTFYERSI